MKLWGDSQASRLTNTEGRFEGSFQKSSSSDSVTVVCIFFDVFIFSCFTNAICLQEKCTFKKLLEFRGIYHVFRFGFSFLKAEKMIPACMRVYCCCLLSIANLLGIETEQEMIKIRRDLGYSDNYVQNFYCKQCDEFLISILKAEDNI